MPKPEMEDEITRLVKAAMQRASQSLAKSALALFIVDPDLCRAFLQEWADKEIKS